MQKLLTIVVPVYKVEPYINKCLDSCVLADEKLMSQLEVIIVNDGTPDNSAEMSREYVKRYPNTFRQINKENGGHGSAWNVGLKEATGKYLRFLDSDDWLTNLDKLMDGLSKTDADLIFTHFNRYLANENRFLEQALQADYNEEHRLEEFPFSENRHFAITNFWATTYKRYILDYGKNIFAEKTMYDDAILFALPAIKAQTYICFDFVVYNYFIGRADQSASVERVPKNIIARAKQAIYMDDFWRKNKPQDLDERVEEGITYYIHNNAWHIFNTIPLLNFKQASILEQQMRHILLYRTSASKNFKRYIKLPFWVYYMLNKIRYWLGKI